MAICFPNPSCSKCPDKIILEKGQRTPKSPSQPREVVGTLMKGQGKANARPRCTSVITIRVRRGIIELSHCETWKEGNLALGSVDLKPQII